jgi:hypothetical protein
LSAFPQSHLPNLVKGTERWILLPPR